MSVSCPQTIIVLKPTNITATDINISTNDCDEPCTVTVTVTWKNIGSRPGTITPGIYVNGTRTPGTEVTLGKNEESTQSFTLNNLVEGNYDVCPDPN